MAENTKRSLDGFNDSANPAEVAFGFQAKSTTSGAAQLGTFGTAVIGTTAESGFIVIELNGTEYKIPFWVDV